METLEVNLPEFDGFYHSFLDITEFIEISNDLNLHGDMTQEEYDNIDWESTNINITKKYLDIWVRKNESVLKDLGIEVTFSKLVSPKEYNFRTDECVITVSFDYKSLKDKLVNLTKDNIDFKIYIKEKYSSYSGFVSFYSNDAEVWLCEYLNTKFDNIVFSGFLGFLTDPLTFDEKIEDVFENYLELISYNI